MAKTKAQLEETIKDLEQQVTLANDLLKNSLPLAEGQASSSGELRVRSADGTFAAPIEGAVYRYDGSDDFVEILLDATDNELEALRADRQRLEIERDDARHKLTTAHERIKDMGTTHGHVDNLKPVV